MRVSRWLIAQMVCVLALTSSLRAEGVKESHDLRVYGKLKAEELPVAADGTRVLRLTAEDRAHAELLISKLVSDFTTLPTVKSIETNTDGGKLIALCFDSGRRMLPLLRGGSNSVDLHLFETDEKLQTFLSSNKLKGAYLLQARKHPFYLDRWDRHAMGFWYAASNGPWYRSDLSNDADFAFFRALNLSINANENFYGPALWCRRSSVGYKINRWFDVSNYAYDAHPEAATKGDPDTSVLYDYYGDVPFAENPIERMQAAEMLANLGQFTSDEYLESITLPHGETGPSATSYQGMRDRDEFSRTDFIHYLRDLRKIELSELGRRWYGNPGAFKNWDDVVFPREREFNGWQEGESQSLSSEWRMRILPRADGETEKVFAPAHDDASWLDFKTGNQAVAGGRAEGWCRRSFTLEPAILKTLADKKPVYLTVCPFNSAGYKNPSTAYLNGDKLGDMTFGHGNEWTQFEVGAQLKTEGPNVITVFTPRCFIGGPVFLTTRKQEAFPTADKGLNARLHDLREWVADCVARANLRYLEYLRGMDPNRPVKIMAYDSMIDVMMPFAELQGAYPHCTGEGAYFRPWFKRYGYLRGIPDSSERSQPCKNVEELRGLFFCMMMEGVNAHDYFIHLHCVTGDPVQKAWYESNVNYFQLMGRFDLKKPEVAIARSPKMNRVYMSQCDDSAYQNDLGRGDIQETHNSYVFCSERDIKDGLVDSYKVIVDCNFHTLDEEDVDVLARWVEKGGKLVLNQRSGRNSFLQANAWPIAKLTGCGYAIRPQEGKVTFEKHPPILKSYAGKSYDNKDNLYDWQKRRYFSDCVALAPKEKDVAVVAKYDDGAPAIVTRPYGKGLVVVLGSSFYRDSHDERGYFVPTHEQTLFYKELFKDLGVTPIIESNQDKLWAERFIANNGTTEMLVLGNKNPTDPLVDVSATWELGFTPKRVFDPATGLDLPVVIEGTKVILSHLTLAPLDMRYYAVERLDTDTAAAVDHWLFRQGQLWKAVPKGRPVPAMDPSWPIFSVGEYLTRQFDTESEARAALAPDFKTDESWQSLLRSDWASAGLRQGKNIWATYRKTIDISPEWLEGLRGATIQWQHFRFEGSVKEMSINGQLVMKDEKPVDGDKLLQALKPGANFLTLLCAGRNDGNGGFTASFCIKRIPGKDGEQMDISKGWDVFTSEHEKVAADFPWSGNRLLARKKFVVPEKYKDCDVWLEVGGTSACAAAMNGRLRYASNAYGSKFRCANPLLLNIAPDVRFGEENDLWIGGGNWHDGFRALPGDYQYATLIFTPKKTPRQ